MLLWLLACSTALADPATAPLPLDPWSAISGASPPVALALALAYGAYQLGAVATRLTASVTAILEHGVPVRVELAAEDRALLERVVEAVEDREQSGGRRAPRMLRSAGEVR